MPFRVPFVNYPLQYSNLKAEIDGKIQGLLSKGDLYLRDDVINFEKDFAKFIGSKHCVSTNSCTDALFLSLYAEGIGPGDEVITVGHTYIATIASIVLNGAKPILIDVGNDYNMDVEMLEDAVTPKTKAIMPVHLNGRCCDMGKIMKVAKKFELAVVEDAAQAVGAMFNGSKAGSFGLTGGFSFYPAKVLGCYGDGGAVTTNHSTLAERLYLLRDNGEKAKYLTKSSEEAKEKKIYIFGFNSVLDNIQAGVLNVKMKYLSPWLERRRDIARMYNEGLSDLSQVAPPPAPNMSPYYDVYQNYVIRVKASDRERLVKYLENNSVEILVSWRTPNHLQSALKLEHFNLPNTEKISREVLSLPLYPELTDEQVNYVIRVVHNFYKSA
ncbi:MAG: DegT/DnrJ/EryC1/StrS family aminotransferase [Candidatus Methanomethylicaceae archaeon]|jgi:dTDP-4-amino-4,6-dideoxygalactose transaminase